MTLKKNKSDGVSCELLTQICDNLVLQQDHFQLLSMNKNYIARCHMLDKV
jgi:hypothetical protein